MPTSPNTISETREFEGDAISGSTIEITKAGDGLSEALQVDPVELHRGEIVYFVLKTRVRVVAFPPRAVMKGVPSDDVVRKHVMDTLDIAIVDETDVAALLQANAERVQSALETLAAQMKVDDPEDHPFEPSPEDAKKCFECGAAKGARWHTKETENDE